MPLNNPQPMTPEARALLRAAEHDLKTVELLLQHPDAPLSSVCFHTQQYLEKVLKAVLVSNAVVFRRTHDLGELAELFTQYGLPLPLPTEQLTRLNPCAVLLRYLDMNQDIPFELISAAEVWSIISATRAWLKEQITAQKHD